MGGGGGVRGGPSPKEGRKKAAAALLCGVKAKTVTIAGGGLTGIPAPGDLVRRRGVASSGRRGRRSRLLLCGVDQFPSQA